MGSMRHKLDAHAGIGLVQAVSKQCQRLHITCRGSPKSSPASQVACCRGHHYIDAMMFVMHGDSHRACHMPG